MKKRVLRFVAAFMAAVTTVVSLNLDSAFSFVRARAAEEGSALQDIQNDGENSGNSSSNSAVESVLKTDSEPVVLTELTEMREENVKHFLMSDQTIQAVVYNEPVHVFDETEQKWLDIDSSFEEISENGTDYLKTIRGNITAAFEKDRTAGFVTDGKSRIEWAFDEDLQKTVKTEIEMFVSESIAEAEKKLGELGKKIEEYCKKAEEFAESLEKYEKLKLLSFLTKGIVDEIRKKLDKVNQDLSDFREQYEQAKEKLAEQTADCYGRFSDYIRKAVSKACYRGIAENTDIEYTNSGNAVKESIIVSARKSAYRYSFRYNTGELSARLNDDGSISIYDETTGEVSYTIAAPFMFDAEGNESDKVYYTLEEETEDMEPQSFADEEKRIKKHVYVITVTADAEWINEKSGKFPVTIDPTIIANSTAPSTDTQSAFVGSYVANKAQGAPGKYARCEMIVGMETSAYGICRTYIKFNLPNLKEEAVVVDAKLNLTVRTDASFITSDEPDVQINAYQVIEKNWDRNTITWNNAPAYDKTILDYSFIKHTDKAGMTKNFDLTKLVKNWYNGMANYGIVLAANDEDKITSRSYAANETFISEREAAYYNKIYPRLIVTYRSDIGIEDFRTCTTVDLGSSGTVYINDYSGRSTITTTGVSTPGNRMPASVYFVNKGNLWKYNVYCTVKKTNFEDAYAREYFPYVYNDSDGTNHYFYKATNNGSVKYYDEDGLGLELKLNPESGCSYLITDSQDNKMYFNNSGVMYKVSDADGNSIKITVDSQGRPTEVIDGAGHRISGVHSDSGATITDPAGRKVVYTFKVIDGVVNVISAQHTDGKIDTYEYDAKGHIIEIKTYDNRKLTLTRKALTVPEVTEINSYVLEGSSWKHVDALKFDRSKYNETKITAPGNDGTFGTTDDLFTTLQFDNTGRTVSVHTESATRDYGTSKYDYTKDAKDTVKGLKTANHLSCEGYTTGIAVNLLSNSGFESSLNGWAVISESNVQPAASDYIIENADGKTDSEIAKGWTVEKYTSQSGWIDASETADIKTADSFNSENGKSFVTKHYGSTSTYRFMHSYSTDRGFSAIEFDAKGNGKSNVRIQLMDSRSGVYATLDLGRISASWNHYVISVSDENWKVNYAKRDYRLKDALALLGKKSVNEAIACFDRVNILLSGADYQNYAVVCFDNLKFSCNGNFESSVKPATNDYIIEEADGKTDALLAEEWTVCEYTVSWEWIDASATANVKVADSFNVANGKAIAANFRNNGVVYRFSHGYRTNKAFSALEFDAKGNGISNLKIQLMNSKSGIYATYDLGVVPASWKHYALSASSAGWKINYANRTYSLSQAVALLGAETVNEAIAYFDTVNILVSGYDFANPASVYFDNLKFTEAESEAGTSFGGYEIPVGKNVTVSAVTDDNSGSSGKVLQGDKAVEIRVYEPVWYKNSIAQDVTGFENRDGSYTLSALVKTEGALRNGNYDRDGKYGVGLFAEIFDKSGKAVESFTSDSLLTESVEYSDNGFERIFLTFKPSVSTSAISKIRIHIFVYNAAGTVYVDNVQLEAGNLASNYNLIEKTGVTGVYDGAGNPCPIQGSATAEKTISKTIEIKDAKPGESYIIGAYAKADAVTLDPVFCDGDSSKNNITNKETKRAFNITATLCDADKDTEENRVTVSSDFNASIDGWQYTELVIVVPDKGNGYAPDRLTVTLHYDYQTGTVYFDKLFAVKDSANSYTYDKDGNVVSVVEDAENKNGMQYENGNLVGSTSSAGYNYSYVYDDRHHLLTASTESGITYTYTYDTFGNAKTLTVTKSGCDSFRTSAEYSSDGAFLTSVTDADGNTTTYVYNTLTGTLSSATDAKGNKTTYTYNSYNDALTSASHTIRNGSLATGKTAKINYLYDNFGRLERISNTKTGYRYEYDSLGRVTRILTGNASVQNKVLSLNTYDPVSGLLTETKYANGWYKNYTYDELGRVIATSINGSPAEEYIYDSTGSLVKYSDKVNKITYNYSYDSTGRSVKTVKTAETGSLAVWSDYDNANNKAFKTLVTGGRTYRHEAVYNSDNQLTGYTVSVDKGNGSSNLASFTYAYDDLGRVVKATNGGLGQNISTDYTYKASKLGSGYTTTLLETETTGNTGFKYEYDSLGNITKVYRKNGSSWALSNSYEYDSLSELIRENDVNNNFTHIYTYDANGNILCRDEYAYTTAASVSYTKTVNGVTVTTIRPNGCTPVKSVVYTYGTGTGDVSTNGINGDSLISYNGKSITYDAVGNPVNYLGNTITWNGRTLTKYVSADGKTTVTYTYDLDGVRTGKMVTEKVGTGASAYTKTTEYSYTYEGTTLLYEKRVCSESSSRNVTVYELYYTYSGLGTLAKIDYSVTTTENGQSSTVSSIYSVVTNSRGDIERIIGSTGTVCAEYVYDAWGNLLETKALTASGTIGSTIADVNPVRYRGYYFDGETGLYYCIARYYDAEVGRLLSLDATDVLGASSVTFSDKNLYAYCDNNPIVRKDCSGYFWDTVFDIVSLCFSISEVVANPIDPWAWAGLAGDIIDLVPFVTGVGETTKTIGATVKVANKIDNTVDTIKIVKATDFTDDAIDAIRKLEKVGDATKSTASAGRQIHKGYKTGYKLIEDMTKEAVKGKNRLDFLDDVHKIIYELKPNNPRGIKNGIQQLQRYNRALGGGYSLILEIY